MTKKEIQDYIRRKDAVAESNYRNYQDSGVTRYETTYRRAEFEADLGRLALNAADDHAELIGMKATIGDLAGRAVRAMHYGDAAELQKVGKELAAYAHSKGLCSDPWR